MSLSLYPMKVILVTYLPFFTSFISKEPSGAVAAPPTMELSGRERILTVADTTGSLLSSSRIMPETLNLDCAKAFAPRAERRNANNVFFILRNWGLFLVLYVQIDCKVTKRFNNKWSNLFIICNFAVEKTHYI